MKKEILVQVGEEGTRVAVIEDERLVEIYFERYQRLVGNICKGRVSNVLPGMQAAFVDIGIERNAFLYVGDVVATGGRDNGSHHSAKLIENVLQTGQEIMVQVTKEPFNGKGARVTTQMTLPGRYVVYMPTVDYIGVSRKIADENERERLRDLAAAVKPKKKGLIVRTVAEGISGEELEEDVKSLEKLWGKITAKSKRTAAPAVLHREVDLIERILRDLFSEEVERLQVNDRRVHDRILKIVGADSNLKRKVALLEGEDLFSRYDVPNQVMQALKHKVWLKCGGFLVIEHMEALTAIDVNTGKYVGRRNLEETVLKTNLEAAVEIARQLRLRNVGGMVIIDFIDMIEEGHRQKVLTCLEEELKKDKTRTRIMGITQLGLVEMTRKKARQALEGVLLQKCPYCEGRGKILSPETVSMNARREIQVRATRQKAPGMLVRAHPDVASLLIGSGGNRLRDLESKTHKRILIKGAEDLHVEDVFMEEMWDEDVGAEAVPVKEGQRMEVFIEDSHALNPQHGIARVQGFILDVIEGGALVGKRVPVEVVEVYRTFAKAQLLEDNY